MSCILIRSKVNSELFYNVEVFILSKLTSYLPEVNSCDDNWNHIRNLPLADPDYKSSKEIEILLGADIYNQVIQNGLIKGSINDPVAQCTSLGWILTCCRSGSMMKASRSTHQASICCGNSELNSQLQKFWELESIPVPSSLTLMSKEEADCEQHFVNTYTRDSTGRFVLRLPFKGEPPKFYSTCKTMFIQIGESSYEKL